MNEHVRALGSDAHMAEKCLEMQRSTKKVRILWCNNVDKGYCGAIMRI